MADVSATMGAHASDGSSSSGNLWIYHEQQEASLCGVHCLNNLMQVGGRAVACQRTLACTHPFAFPPQMPLFSAADLAEVAQELDAKERVMMMEQGTETRDAIMFAAEG